MRVSIRLLAVMLVLTAGLALAQSSGASSPSVMPSVPGSTVPSWVFYWVLGLTSGGAVIWGAITKILWDRGTNAQDKALEAKEKAGGLTKEEKEWLKELHAWHKPVDDNQIPLWYVPRSWVEHIHSLRNEQIAVKDLLTKLVQWNEEIISDLRLQLKESRGLQAQQQTKMLKLAVRVQRAVEALAGLKVPEIEPDLGDGDGDEE